jgi:hypothetical protein
MSYLDNRVAFTLHGFASIIVEEEAQPLKQHLPRLTSDIKKIVGSKADKKEKIKK